MGGTALLDFALATVKSIFGSLVREGFLREQSSSWLSDPFSLGAFTYAPPGTVLTIEDKLLGRNGSEAMLMSTASNSSSCFTTASVGIRRSVISVLLSSSVVIMNRWLPNPSVYAIGATSGHPA